MACKPCQSCLAPHEGEIVALRRMKPPTPYARIAELLRERHQISVCRETVFRFVQVRAKGRRPCKYAWNVEPAGVRDRQAARQPASQGTPAKAPSPQGEGASMPKPPVPARPEPRFEYQYSPDYNLHRLSPEEAAARLGKLEEQENR